MSESENKSVVEEVVEEVQEESSPKKSRKLFFIIPILLVIILGAGGFFLYQKSKAAAEENRMAEQAKSKKELIFKEFDDMLINLNTGGKAVSFLKLQITFELDSPENEAAVEKNQPRILDVLQLYLRDLRPSDLHGAVGLYRLREELLLRINRVIHPAYVNDILFRDIKVH